MALRRAGARLSTALASSPSLRLLEGRAALIQPHELRPKGIIDQLTGKEVEIGNEDLGAELPNVDLRQEFTADEIETIQQASDDAGGILVFTNQDPSMTVHHHVAFARQIAAADNTVIEPHAVTLGLPEAPEVLQIVREASAHVVFGENWHSDHSFMGLAASYSILRVADCPRFGVNDTLFSSTEDAFDALSQTMQNLILDLNAYHSANKAYGVGHPGNSLAAMQVSPTPSPQPEPLTLNATSSPPLPLLPTRCEP